MAATTSGWQWPVETTAMPAEKSKNSFPSISVTTIPRPLFATRGYERVYDGEMYFSSPARMRLAFGPGSAVVILGPARALVVMGSSEFGRWFLGVESLAKVRTEHNLSRTQKGGSRVSRYQKDWVADETAAPPDTAAGTPGTLASMRANANWTSEGA